MNSQSFHFCIPFDDGEVISACDENNIRSETPQSKKNTIQAFCDLVSIDIIKGMLNV